MTPDAAHRLLLAIGQLADVSPARQRQARHTLTDFGVRVYPLAPSPPAWTQLTKAQRRARAFQRQARKLEARKQREHHRQDLIERLTGHRRHVII